MNNPINWAAELAHVREVSLLGTADLAFWKNRLTKENLFPTERDGQAQLLIVAAEAKYMSVWFRELSFSVLVCQQENGNRQDGAYLIRAFNSSQCFAFCERVFFSTPYYGDVRLSASFPASIRLMKKGEVVFQAEMRADIARPDRQPSRRGEDGWEGPVFLPENRRGKGCQGNLFFAHIRGYTQIYSFLPEQDSVTLSPAPDSEFVQALLDSHFVAQEWGIRADATHTKSKTYKRAEVLGGVTPA